MIPRKTDFENNLYKLYYKIEEIESLTLEARAKKKAVIAEKMSTDNGYKSIIYMDKFYDNMNAQEKEISLSRSCIIQ